MATVLDCMLHPIDCANASAAAQTARATATAATGAVSGTSSGAATVAEDVAHAATEPLGAIRDTSMWITIGVVAASIVALVVVLYIIYRVELA